MSASRKYISHYVFSALGISCFPSFKNTWWHTDRRNHNSDQKKWHWAGSLKRKIGCSIKVKKEEHHLFWFQLGKFMLGFLDFFCVCVCALCPFNNELWSTAHYWFESVVFSRWENSQWIRINSHYFYIIVIWKWKASILQVKEGCLASQLRCWKRQTCIELTYLPGLDIQPQLLTTASCWRWCWQTVAVGHNNCFSPPRKQIWKEFLAAGIGVA